MFGRASSDSRDTAKTQRSQSSGGTESARTSDSPEIISSLGSGVTVHGKIVGDGTLKIFGRVEGELQAKEVLICEGAQVDGNVAAQELTIAGRVKGTIHAARVVLRGTAEVEGDIFHRSLSIEENARFEGSSRRESDLPDAPLSIPVKGREPQSPAKPQVALFDGNGGLKETPESASPINPPGDRS